MKIRVVAVAILALPLVAACGETVQTHKVCTDETVKVLGVKPVSSPDETVEMYKPIVKTTCNAWEWQ